MSKYRKEYIFRMASPGTNKPDACLAESLNVARGDTFLPAPRPEGPEGELLDVRWARWMDRLDEWIEDVDEVMNKKLEAMNDER